MTSTTIQLDQKIKDELFLLKNQIEKKLGRSISYNELINMLLENNKASLLRRNLKEFQKLRGIISRDSIKTFQKERKIDSKAEEYE